MAKRSGPPYRRIVVTFWNDPDVKRKLTLEEKAFLAYLFSNEHSHPCGVYRLTPIHVLDELGVDRDRMRALFEGPIKPFATYDWRTEEVFVRNMAEHQIDGGLHGQDRRILWVANQLKTIHSDTLIQAFATRYNAWNLPWSDFLSGIDGNPHSTAKEEGAYDGAYDAPSDAPSHAPSKTRGSSPEEDTKTRSDENGSVEPNSKGHTKGHRMPDPVPVPEVFNNPPAPSGEALGREVDQIVDEPGRKRPEHPELRRLWDGGLRDVVRRVWHHEADEVVLDRTEIGMGLEFWLVNDLLEYSGEPELVEWLVAEAPHQLGWDTVPRSLHWAVRSENYWAAASVYRRRGQLPSGATSAVDVKKPPGAASDEPGVEKRKAELREQIERARAEHAQPGAA